MDDKKLPEKATVKKPSLFRDLVEYALKEEIEPRSKEITRNVINGTIGMFNDAATKAVDKWLYPDGNAPRSKNTSPNNNSRTNYATRIFNSETRGPKETITTRSSVDLQLIWVNSREDADEIVKTLLEEIDMYGKTKVATYYETVSRICHVHIPTTFSDFKYGWTSKERNAISYYSDKGQWFIDLPKPVNIENI